MGWSDIFTGIGLVWVTCTFYIVPSALENHDRAHRETHDEMMAENLKFWYTVLFAPYYLAKAVMHKNAWRPPASPALAGVNF